VGRGVFLGGQPRPYRKGAVPQRFPNFGGSLLLMHTSFDAELPNVDVGTRVGEGHVSWVSHASHSKRAEFQGAPILGVCRYLCLHPLTQNNQIRYGNTYGEECVLHLHKCVARLSATAEFLVLPSNKNITFVILLHNSYRYDILRGRVSN